MRKNIKANVATLSFVAEILLSKSADAAPAAHKFRKERGEKSHLEWYNHKKPICFECFNSSQPITRRKIM